MKNILKIGGFFVILSFFVGCGDDGGYTGNATSSILCGGDIPITLSSDTTLQSHSGNPIVNVALGVATAGTTINVTGTSSDCISY